MVIGRFGRPGVAFSGRCMRRWPLLRCVIGRCGRHHLRSRPLHAALAFPHLRSRPLQAASTVGLRSRPPQAASTFTLPTALRRRCTMGRVGGVDVLGRSQAALHASSSSAASKAATRIINDAGYLCGRVRDGTLRGDHTEGPSVTCLAVHLGKQPGVIHLVA